MKKDKSGEAGEAIKVKAPKVSSGEKKGRASARERKKKKKKRGFFISWIAPISE